MSLEACSLSFGYSNTALFTEMNLRVDPGQVLGLHGFSGSGKTTLGKILAGYWPANQGKVLVDGKELNPHGKKSQFSGQKFRHEKFCPVQMVHQHSQLAVDPRWKLRKLFESGQYQSLSNPDGVGQKKDALLELFEAFEIETQWLDRYPVELSGGQLQRCMVARALDRRTKYLILDEITTMLDAICAAQLWKEIMGFAQKRKLGLLVISHDQDLLDRLCSKTISIPSSPKQSKPNENGTPSTLLLEEYGTIKR